jgi:hypothetical protein
MQGDTPVQRAIKAPKPVSGAIYFGAQFAAHLLVVGPGTAAGSTHARLPTKMLLFHVQTASVPVCVGCVFFQVGGGIWMWLGVLIPSRHVNV